MTSTNYLNPTDFKKMVDVMPQVTDYNKGKLLGIQADRVPDPRQIQMFMWIQYCCALRVSECLLLHTESFDFENNILTLSHTKTGFKIKDGVKVRKNQYTSIPPDFPDIVKKYIIIINRSLFESLDRQLIWKYYKQAAKLADINLAEQQDERLILGAWTHLLRKSRAKYMMELGAAEVMVKVKLRHSFTVTDRYTKPDINALIQWERENIK